MKTTAMDTTCAGTRRRRRARQLAGAAAITATVLASLVSGSAGGATNPVDRCTSANGTYLPACRAVAGRADGWFVAEPVVAGSVAPDARVPRGALR